MRLLRNGEHSPCSNSETAYKKSERLEMSVWKSLSALLLGLCLIVGCTGEAETTPADDTSDVGDAEHEAMSEGGSAGHDAEGGSNVGGGAPEEGGEEAAPEETE
jgi:hypothetical protein